jgi:cardiolipin synthase
MQLITAPNYYRALQAGIPKAKKRIIIHAMGILWGPKTEMLIPPLLDAAKRGVEVQVVGDIYSKFITYMPRPFREKLPPWSRVRAGNDKLRAGGVNVTYVGSLGPNPFKRRCHTKWTIIDDLVYSFGGINIAEDSFTNHDYMLETRNGHLADYLNALTEQIATGASILPDHTKQLTARTTILFDGGTPGASIIYDTACDIVAQAKKVYFVSQMCPSGRLARLINARDNECYFVRPGQTEFPANLALVRDRSRFRVINRYRGKTYIHAKFILTEGSDGQRHFIGGSNNFSRRGVDYGTKEIAVHSTDPQLWQQLYDFMQKQIIGG